MFNVGFVLSPAIFWISQKNNNKLDNAYVLFIFLNTIDEIKLSAK